MEKSVDFIGGIGNLGIKEKFVLAIYIQKRHGVQTFSRKYAQVVINLIVSISSKLRTFIRLFLFMRDLTGPIHGKLLSSRYFNDLVFRSVQRQQVGSPIFSAYLIFSPEKKGDVRARARVREGKEDRDERTQLPRNHRQRHSKPSIVSLRAMYLVWLLQVIVSLHSRQVCVEPYRAHSRFLKDMDKQDEENLRANVPVISCHIL